MRLCSRRAADIGARSPGRLHGDEVCRGLVDRRTDLGVAVHVLLDEVGAVRGTSLVPTEGADERRDLARVGPVDELLLALALLRAADRLDDRRDELADG